MQLLWQEGLQGKAKRTDSDAGADRYVPPCSTMINLSSASGAGLKDLSVLRTNEASWSIIRDVLYFNQLKSYSLNVSKSF